MPTVDIDEIIEKINALLRRISDKIEEIRQKANLILVKLPKAVMSVALSLVIEKFIEGWNTMLGKLDELWDWFANALAHVGDPNALDDRGEDWHTLVGVPAKREADQLDDSHELLVDDTWTGTAAAAYKEKVPAQEEDLRSLGTTFASGVQSALNSVAFGIKSFWAAIVAALIALVAACVAAYAEAATLVGLPAVPPTVMAGIVVFLTAAAAGTINLARQQRSAADSLRNLVRYGTGWSDFAL